MARSVEERVVRMQFDNDDFEKKTAQSLSTIEKLKDALDFDNVKGSADKLREVAVAADELTAVDMGSPFSAAMEKASVFGTFANQMIRNVANTAYTFGKQIVSSLTIDPVKTGFQEYEEKMDAIKVTLANTGRPLEDVKRTLEDLNKYADETIYSFSDMTANLGKFTAQGVGLEDSAAAIKGISNLAAITGANTEQASRAMYNFSQALAIGKMQLVDWKTMENTGMGNDRFRKELIETAKELGYFERAWTNAQNQTIAGQDLLQEAQTSFRETLKWGWMDKELMLATLKKYSDETTQIGKEASAAAKEVRTFSKMMDTLQEAVQSGWGMAWERIVGDYAEAGALFTGLSDFIGGFIDDIFDAKIAVLDVWRTLGGRTDLFEGLRNILESLYLIVKPITEAFNEIFPPKTGQQLADMTKAFRDFTNDLKISQSAYDGINTAFKGLFSVVKLVADVIGKLVKSALKPMQTIFMALVNLIGTVVGKFGELLLKITGLTSHGTETVDIFQTIGNVLQTVANVIATVLNVISALIDHFVNFEVIGRAVETVLGLIGAGFYTLITAITKAASSLAEFVKNSGVLTKIGTIIKTVGGIAEKVIKVAVTGITAVIALIVKLVKNVKEFLSKIVDLDKVRSILAKIGDVVITVKDEIVEFFNRLREGESILSIIKEKFDGLREIFTGIQQPLTEVHEGLDFASEGDKFGGILETLKDGLFKVTEQIKEFAKSITPAKVMAAGLMVGLLVLIHSIDRVSTALAGITEQAKGFMTKINGLLSGITTKTAPITTVSRALALLAGSLALLTLVDQDKLKNAALIMAGLGAGMGVLAGAMGKLAESIKKNGTDKAMETLAKSMVGFAASIAIMVVAFNMLETVDWPEMGKKFAVLGVLGLELSAFAWLINKINPKLTKGVLGLLVFSLSLEKVVKAFVTLSNADINKARDSMLALGEIAGIMAALAFASKGLGVGSAIGLIAMCYSLEKVMPTLERIGNIDLSGLEAVIKRNQGAVIALGAFIATMTIVAAAGGKNLAKLNSSFALLGFAMIEMAAAIKIVSTIPNGDILKASGVMIGLLAVVGVMEALSNRTAGNAFARFGFGMIGVGLAMIELAQAIKMIASVPVGDVIKAGVTVGGLMAVFGYMENISGLTHNINTKAIGALAASMLVLGGELIALSLINWQDLIAPTIAIVAVMKVFGDAINAIGKVKIGGTDIAAMVIMAGSMLILGGDLAILAQYPWENIAAAGAAMSIGMLSIGGAMALAGQAAKSASIGDIFMLAAMAAGMLPVAAAIQTLSQYSWNEMVPALGAMGASLTAMTVALIAMSRLGKSESGLDMLGMAAGFIAIAGAMNLLVPALQGFATVNPEAMVKAGLALLVITGALVALSNVGAGFAMVGVGILAIGGALTLAGAAMIEAQYAFSSFVDTLDRFKDIDLTNLALQLESIVPALQSLGIVAIEFGAAILLASKGLPLFIVLIGGLLGALALIPTVVDSLMRFSDVIDTIRTTSTEGLAETLTAVADAFKYLVLIGIEGVVGAVGVAAIGAAMLVLSGGLGAISLTAPAAINSLNGLVMFFSQLDSGLVVSMAGSLVTLSLAFGAMGIAGVALTAGIVGLTAFSAILPLMGSSLEKVSNVIAAFPTDMLLQIGMILERTGGSFLVFSMAMGVLAVASIGMNLAAAALPNLSMGLLMLATALDQIAKSNLTFINGEMAQFVVAMGILAALGSQLLTAAAGYSAFALAMGQFGENVKSFMTAVMAIGMIDQSSIDAFSNFCSVLSKAADPIARGGIAMGIAAPAMTAFGSGLMVLAPGLVVLGQAVDKIDLEKVTKALPELATSLGDLALVAIAGAVVGPGLIKIGEGMSSMSVGLEQLLSAFQNVDPKVIAEGLNDLCIPMFKFGLAAADMVLAGAGIAAVGGALLVFNPAAKELSTIDIDQIADGFDHLFVPLNNVSGISNDVSDFALSVMKLAAGFRELNGELNASIITLIEDCVDALSDLPEKFEESGKLAMAGLAKGFSDETARKTVYDSIKEVGTNLLNTFYKVVGQHSPWETTEESGKFGLKGLINGFSNSGLLSNLFSKVSDIGGGIVSKLKESIVNGFQGFSLDGLINNFFGGADVTSLVGGDATSWLDGLTQKADAAGFSLDIFGKKSSQTTIDIEEMMDKVREGTPDVFDLGSAFDELTESTGKASKATGGASKAAKENTEEDEKLEKALKNLTSASHVFAHEYSELNEALDDTDALEQAMKGFEALGMTMEEFGEFCDSIESKVASTLDNIFDAPKDRGWMDKNALLYNMRENLNQVSQWADSMGRLAERGLDQGIYQKLAEMGPEGYKYVHAFSEMTDEELERASSMWGEKITLTQAAKNRVAGGFLECGYMAVKGLEDGLADTEGVIAAADALADAGEETIREDWGIHSPSELFKEIGRWVPGSITMGIYEGVDDLVFAIQVVCDRILTEFDVKLVNNSRIPEIGKQLMAKLATGMMLSVATFDAIVEEMISTVVKAINKKAKEINQNGTYICEWMVKGFSEAMPKQEKTINETMKKMMDLLVKGFQTDENKSVISKDFVEWFVQNFCDAILDENTSLETFTTTYEELVAWMDETLREYQETFYNIGAFWMEGLAQGITENGQMAIAAAQAVANEIIEITKQTQEMHSPSKVAIKIGKWWDQGLAKGIMNYRKLPVVSAKKLAKQIVKLTSNTIPELSKKIEAKVKPSVKKIAEAIASETDTIQIFKKTDKIAKAFVPISKYAKSTAKATSGSVKEIWVNVEKAGTKVSKTVNNAIKFVKNLKTNIEKFDSADKLTKAFSGLDKYFIDYDKVPGKVIKFLQNVSSEMDPIGDSVKYLAEEFYGADKYTAGFNESTVKAMGALSNFMGIIFDSTEAGKEYTKNLEDAAEAEQKYAEKRDEINQKLAEGEEVSESEYEKLQELEKEWQEAQAKVGTWLQAGTKAYKEYRDGIVETLKTQTSFFEALEKGTVTSPATMIFNKKSWIQGDKDFNSMITDLAKRGLEPDILKDALEEGVTSANLAMLQSFSNASDADIAMINQLIEKQKNVATKSGKQATAAVVEAFSDDAAEQRKTMSDQIDQGLVMWYNSFEGGFGKIKKIIKNFSEDTQEFKTFAGKMSEAISSIAPAFDLLGEKYLGISNASQLLDTDSMKAAKQVLKLGEAFGMVAEDSETYEHYVQRIADGIHEWGESLKEVYAISNPFEKFEKNSEISGSELLDNMQSQLNGVRDWASGLEELSKRGLSSALVKYLAELGPEAANYVDAFLSMTQSQIGEANEMYGQVLTIKDETAEQAKASWMYTGTKMGQAAQKGAKDAFEKEGSIRFPYGEEEAEEDGKDIGKAVSTGVVEETEDTGETVMYMICDGIEGHEPEIITTVRKSGKAISDTYVETVENEETGTKIANAVASSMNNGITESVESNVPKIVSSVQEQMTALADKIESALNKAFTNASETAIDKMNKAINKINKLIDEIPETISIKINVDTSDAQSAVNELNSAVRRLESNVASVNASVRSTATMYNNLSNGNGYSSYGSTYGTNGATTANNGKNGNSANNGGITINYNQTNNSPKALSVVEVYKNTQNQLVAVKSAISSMTGVKTY